VRRDGEYRSLGLFSYFKFLQDINGKHFETEKRGNRAQQMKWEMYNE